MEKDPIKPPKDVALGVMAAMDREFHEQSDRAVAVVGAAYLDAMLESLLRAVFIDDVPAELNDLLKGSLGSNGARNQLAYCLGLITTDQWRDLKRIAKIRNAFAHDFTKDTFEEPSIRQLCAELQQPGILADMSRQLFTGEAARRASEYVHETTATPREKYRLTVTHLFGSLLRRATYVRRVSRADWFSYDPDAAVGPAGREGGA